MQLRSLFLVLLWYLVATNAGLLVVSPANGDEIPLASGTIYYVSSSTGNDANPGTAPAQPLRTIAAVNNLTLQPGDQVRFACGDIWRAESLVVKHAGSDGNPIIFGSYPAICSNQPIISGAQPITGWTLHSSNIYVADLTAGENAGKFALGINQLFAGEERLPFGRFPNLDAPDAGYATIDAQPAANQFVDNELPAVDWTGARVHIKGMRWYILNRSVTATSGTTLTLNSGADCWGDGNTCPGWGYFLSNHLATLDQPGEWYYDETAQRVYLFSTQGTPTNIEGSVITHESGSWGGVVLGTLTPIHYVTVDNLAIRRWYRYGITMPINQKGSDNSHLTLQNNTITDIDGVGLNLATWVFEATAGVDGWRGGSNQLIANNIIDIANQRGIDTYSIQSVFRDNIVRNVGLIENLGRAGMGCSTESSGGACTEDGDGIRIKIGQAVDSGNQNTLLRNRIERVGYNGVDIFGYKNRLENNIIVEACYSKGDCGGVRTFGNDNLATTPVYEIVFQGNIIRDTIGNTDGTIAQYRSLFGFGLYIDYGSRDVQTSGNTIIGSTAVGILYANSTGTIVDNVLYDNQTQVSLGSSSQITTFTGNILYGVYAEGSNYARTLSISNPDQVQVSDNNAFFQPYNAKHIAYAGNKTLAEWQAASGKDAHSYTNWFSLNVGDAPRSGILYNESSAARTFGLGDGTFQNVLQQAVTGAVTLQPYTSLVLIGDGVHPVPTPGDPPTLTANHSNGSAGSTFLVTGVNFPLTDAALTVQVNGAAYTLTAPLHVSDAGEVSFLVQTEAGLAPGDYLITVMSNPSVSVLVHIVDDGTTPHPAPDGSSGLPTVTIAAGTTPLVRMYLPMVQ